MKIKTLKHKLNQIRLLLQSARVFSQGKGSYLFVTRQHNPQLFELLKEVRFFKFHITNRKQQIVGVHQIVLFCSKGWKKMLFGLQCRKGATEVHHLDHNPQNNADDNLWYVTPTENKVIADITTACCSVTIQPYRGEVKFDLDRINIFGGEEPFYKLLIRSLKATSSQFNGDLLVKFVYSLPFHQAKLLARFIKQCLNTNCYV